MCLAFWETLKNRNQMEDFSFTVHPFCFEFEEFQFKKKNGVLQHEILLCLWHYSPVEKCLPMGSTARATTSKLKGSLLCHEIKCFSTSSNSPSEVNMKKKKKGTKEKQISTGKNKFPMRPPEQCQAKPTSVSLYIGTKFICLAGLLSKGCLCFWNGNILVQILAFHLNPVPCTCSYPS